MYTFEEKNQIIQSLAGAKHFEKDRVLFLQHCSNSKLERDLKKANQFTYLDLDARMICDLLNHVSEETILMNRNGGESLNSKLPDDQSALKDNSFVLPVPQRETDTISKVDKKKEASKKSSKK